jgi:hypothetical protein
MRFAEKDVRNPATQQCSETTWEILGMFDLRSCQEIARNHWLSKLAQKTDEFGFNMI